MNAGELNEKISLLSLSEISDSSFEWVECRALWAKAEESEKTNLFSSVGLGARSASFVIRKYPISLHDAFHWNGQHYFLTFIKEVDRMYLEIAAAKVTPKRCTVFRASEYGDEPEKVLQFPAVVTEKYIGHEQLEPMARISITYVLVTPKAAVLKVGDLAEIEGKRYAVQACHTTDEYKNEYEVFRGEDA